MQNDLPMHWHHTFQIDQQLESGEYFLKDSERQAQKRAERSRKQTERVDQQKLKRAQSFVPPSASTSANTTIRSKKKDAAVTNVPVDVEKLKQKVKRKH